MSNIFETAARRKYRFETSRGELTVENLWDLKLQDLNTFAKSINKKLRESGEEDFIPASKSAADTVLETKLSILKHIIGVKLEEQTAAKNLAEQQAKVEQLKTLIANKSDEALAAKSLDELQAMLNDLIK